MAQYIAVDRNDVKWFLGMELTSFDGEAWKTQIGEYTFPFNYAEDFIVDRTGIAWFATYGSGLWCWGGLHWKNITAADGLTSDQMQSVAVGPDGRIWAAAVNGLSWFDGNSWESHSSDTPLSI